MAMKDPPHPGEFVRSGVLEPKGLSVAAAARRLRVSRAALSGFLNGRVRLSAAMARRIEEVFRVRAGTLLRMQAAYDTAKRRPTGRVRLGTELRAMGREARLTTAEVKRMQRLRDKRPAEPITFE